MEKRYEFQADVERHECMSWQENDHIIFRCTQCDFVRRIDLQTGKLSVVKIGDPDALHRGAHQPLGSSSIVVNQN